VVQSPFLAMMITSGKRSDFLSLIRNSEMKK